MLVELMENPGVAVSFERLLRRSRGPGCHHEADILPDQVKVQMSYLRRALRAAGCVDPIDNVWGYGFRLSETHRTHILLALGQSA